MPLLSSHIHEDKPHVLRTTSNKVSEIHSFGGKHLLNLNCQKKRSVTGEGLTSQNHIKTVVITTNDATCW